MVAQRYSIPALNGTNAAKQHSEDSRFGKLRSSNEITAL